MALSIFLAKLLGLYMLIVGLIALARREQFQRSVINSMLSSEGLLAYSGAINIVLGLAILIGHPVWELNWHGLITLIGLLILVQGILRMGFTTEIQRWWSHKKMQNGYWVIFGVVTLVGAYLTYVGFSH